MPFTRLGDLGGHGHQMPSQCLSRFCHRLQPVAGTSGVGQRFLSAEGLGANDDQCGFRVQCCQRAIQIVRIDVGDKMRFHWSVDVFEGIVDQPRAQI